MILKQTFLPFDLLCWGPKIRYLLLNMPSENQKDKMRFIEDVEANPLLWDKTHDDHKNTKKTSAKWDEFLE